MKIKDIRAAAIDIKPQPKTIPTSPKLVNEGFATPMSRYPDFRRANWTTGWQQTACIVTAEDGTWGLGLTVHGGPVEQIINGHFAPTLRGQDCMATKTAWDVMRRVSAQYGTGGLASYAISAVDNALWDLKGKLLGRPVYELLGGPQKESIPVYASNTILNYGTEETIAWFLELGFKAVKLFLRDGPESGLEGLRRSEELVARTRQQIGDDVELMVDGWMSLNVEYIVRLAEILRPYRIKWLEDYLLPEDMDGYMKVRERLPGTILATGEHWTTIHPFAFAASRGLVDIMQPDIAWVGGMTASVRICHIAEAHGLTVIGHAGMNYPYGQHLAMAMPAIPMGERSEGVAAPGVPLEEMIALPGTVAVKNGRVRPTDAPGFGIEVTRDWLESHTI